jgi:hypothetical protein
MVHMVDAYRRNGVTSMTLTANSDVGGYAWARAGFDFGEPEILTGGREAIAKLFLNKTKSSRYDATIKAEMRRVARNPHASPIDFAMIGHTPGATMWPGKEIMLGSTWNAMMTL